MRNSIQRPLGACAVVTLTLALCIVGCYPKNTRLSTGATTPRPAPSLTLRQAMFTNTATVENLLKQGVKVDDPDSMGYTSLMVAARDNNVSVVKVLLAHKANVNLQNHTGETALIAAIRYGSTEPLRLLLAHGANVNLRTNQGLTPLAVAKLKQRYYHTGAPIVEILKQAGAH